jgi:hypothetical protein
VLELLPSKERLKRLHSRVARDFAYSRLPTLITPWGAQTRSSGRRFVFVNESAEEVAPPHVQRMNRRCRGRIASAAAIRRSQIERLVRTLLAEVADVDAEDVLELAVPENQEPVEALAGARCRPTARRWAPGPASG